MGSTDTQMETPQQFLNITSVVVLLQTDGTKEE